METAERNNRYEVKVIPARYNSGLLIFSIINISSTCFGCLYTHHQESRSGLRVAASGVVFWL
jgi:hypothetical protein